MTKLDDGRVDDGRVDDLFQRLFSMRMKGKVWTDMKRPFLLFVDR